MYHMKEHLLDKLVSMDTSEHENLLAKWCKGDVEMFEMIQGNFLFVDFSFNFYKLLLRPIIIKVNKKVNAPPHVF